MENLYRVFNKNKSHKKLRERDSIIRNLEGKKYFTKDDLEKLFEYKGVTHPHSNRFVKKYTQKAFESDDLEQKIRSLKRLNGVGMVMASTILTMQNPYRFAELDHMVWDTLQTDYSLEGTEKDHRSDYGIGEYERYMDILRNLGEEYGMKASDVEFVLEILDEQEQ